MSQRVNAEGKPRNSVPELQIVVQTYNLVSLYKKKKSLPGICLLKSPRNMSDNQRRAAAQPRTVVSGAISCRAVRLCRLQSGPRADRVSLGSCRPQQGSQLSRTPALCWMVSGTDLTRLPGPSSDTLSTNKSSSIGFTAVLKIKDNKHTQSLVGHNQRIVGNPLDLF